MLSVARERPIDPRLLEILTLVDRITRELTLDYFVTGAMAREILLNNVFGIDAGRETYDVDLAIALDGWGQFDMIKTRLVEMAAFVCDPGVAHRLWYRRGTKKGLPLDLIPFGDIEQGAYKIAWPPDQSIVMNMAGYREAFSAAQEVEIAQGFVVRVASLSGLAILKLFAWVDRGADTDKDARDLATLLRRYSAAGNEDRLYGEEFGIMETLNYDLDLAGARLLGRDAAWFIEPTTRTRVLALLDDGALWGRLVRDMSREFPTAEDSVAEAESVLAQFQAGLRDRPGTESA